MCAIPVDILTSAAPVYRRPAEEPARIEELQRLDAITLREPTDFSATLQTLLESPNLCSREWVYRQYDQIVGGKNPVWNQLGHERMGWALSVFNPATP